MKTVINSKGRNLIVSGEYIQEKDDFLVDDYGSDRYGDDIELSENDKDEARFAMFEEKRKQK